MAFRKLGAKGEIDYRRLEKHCRHKHAEEINEYLKQDLVVLYAAVARFHEEFGPKLTIGGTQPWETERDSTLCQTAGVRRRLLPR